MGLPGQLEIVQVDRQWVRVERRAQATVVVPTAPVDCSQCILVVIARLFEGRRLECAMGGLLVAMAAGFVFGAT